MTLRTATLLALVGAVLAAIALVLSFVEDLLHAMRDLIPAMRIIPSFIYAFAAVTAVIFLYVFHKRQP